MHPRAHFTPSSLDFVFESHKGLGLIHVMPCMIGQEDTESPPCLLGDSACILLNLSPCIPVTRMGDSCACTCCAPQHPVPHSPADVIARPLTWLALEPPVRHSVNSMCLAAYVQCTPCVHAIMIAHNFGHFVSALMIAIYTCMLHGACEVCPFISMHSCGTRGHLSACTIYTYYVPSLSPPSHVPPTPISTAAAVPPPGGCRPRDEGQGVLGCAHVSHYIRRSSPFPSIPP